VPRPIVLQILIKDSSDSNRPQTAKELYNLRHSSLRNAIERIFGVMKKRFKILTDQLEYSYKIQVRLVKVICCLHNIIRLKGGNDLFDKLWLESQAKAGMSTANGTDETEEEVICKAVTAAEMKQANALRDGIANAMWAQYIRYKR
jgi:DDE superfamily endonuclease